MSVKSERLDAATLEMRSEVEAGQSVRDYRRRFSPVALHELLNKAERDPLAHGEELRSYLDQIHLYSYLLERSAVRDR
jgi:hypothetical protein